jgi:hypothetical protein
MKTATYKWARRWKRAVAAGQYTTASQLAFEVKCNAFYGY